MPDFFALYRPDGRLFLISVSSEFDMAADFHDEAAIFFSKKVANRAAKQLGLTYDLDLVVKQVEVSPVKEEVTHAS